MFHDDHDTPPLNPLPPVVIVFALAITGIEMYLQAADHGYVGGRGGVGLRLEMITTYGFFSSVFHWMLETGRAPAEHLLRLLSYSFIHASFTQAAFGVVMLLAIGKMVAEVFSALAFVAIYLLSTLAGALAYGAFLDTNVPLIGAFPAVYGMIGALTFMLWTKARMTGDNQFRAFSLIAALMGIQLLFRLIFGGANDWVADIAGFGTGFALSFLLAPDGSARILEWLENIRRRR